MENTPRLNMVIDVLMLAGAILAQSGAEIHRVEDTMIRLHIHKELNRPMSLPSLLLSFLHRPYEYFAYETHCQFKLRHAESL